MPDVAARLIRRRLENQGLSRIRFSEAVDVVRWFGGVQAQDFAGAKWAIAQRLSAATDADVERAFDAGEILRTHVLRPTWHFVAPEDLRWMLALTAPRIHQFNGFNYRKYALDGSVLARTRRILERALDKGDELTREELGAALRRSGVVFDGVRLAHIVMHAELEGAICSGRRRGKQFTYALASRRLRRSRAMDRDEALAELARRFFNSHGPATARDFSWWSGLSLTDARVGLAGLAGAIERESIEGLTYYVMPSRPARVRAVVQVHLLPNFDECLVAYKDRDVIGALERPARTGRFGSFAHQLLVDGQVSGAWRRTTGTRETRIEVLPYRPLSRAELEALDTVIARHAAFAERPVSLTVLR